MVCWGKNSEVLGSLVACAWSLGSEGPRFYACRCQIPTDYMQSTCPLNLWVRKFCGRRLAVTMGAGDLKTFSSDPYLNCGGLDKRIMALHPLWGWDVLLWSTGTNTPISKKQFTLLSHPSPPLKKRDVILLGVITFSFNIFHDNFYKNKLI